jgi:hypothetical protein
MSLVSRHDRGLPWRENEGKGFPRKSRNEKGFSFQRENEGKGFPRKSRNEKGFSFQRELYRKNRS